jgi:hypothetical protein
MKRVIWLGLWVFVCVWRVDAGNLLLNPGFEDPYTNAVPATNWWYYDAAGRETWAHRGESKWGNTFYPAGHAYGGFGQDVPVATNGGQVFQFVISGKAEPNYTNDNTTIAIEFFEGATYRYSVVRNVYDELDAERGDWVYLALRHTNTVANIDQVKVRCDFADCTITADAHEATCQWDDGRFYQLDAPEPVGYGLSKHEPISGVYLGVLLERGGTEQEMADFNANAGKPHAVYAKFLIFKQDPFPWEWVNTVKSNYPGAGLHLVLEPMVDFEDFYAPDWGPGQETYDAALQFVTNCAHTEMPVFLRFAHEANGDWYPWHPQFSERYGIPDTVSNETYIAGFRNFADLVHSNAPNVAMVWAPNQGNGPDPMPYYEDVYPGDAYVDWVGLSVYNGWSYGNSNEVLDFQFRNAIQKGYWQENDDPYDDTFENFYWTFSDPDNPVGHKKPMMIAETAAAFEPKYAVSNEILIAGFESLDGPQFTASNTLCEFQSLNSDGWISSNHVWVDGFEVLTAWNGGPWGTNGYTWSNTADCIEGTNAVVMGGAPEAGGTYVGGNLRNIGSVPFTVTDKIAEFQDLESDGTVAGNHFLVESFESTSTWWGGSGAPWGTLTTWSNDARHVEGTNAFLLGGMPASGNWVGGNGRDERAFTNWTDYDGIELWVQTATESNAYPTLSVRVRTVVPDADTHVADSTFTATTTSYVPKKISFDDMDLTGSPDFGKVTALILSLSSTVADTRPADLLIDRWSLVTLSNAPYMDQYWDVPWVDGADADGAFSFSLTADPYGDYPTQSLVMAGADSNANSYVGGNSFFTREEGRDWSSGSHLGLLMRRDGDTNGADPLLRLEVIDGSAHTASVSQVAAVTNYTWALIAYSNMTVDAGFAWTNVEQVKFHLLSGTAGKAPADLYVKAFHAGVVSNETPADWSAYDGIELMVKREDDTNVMPILSVSIRSVTTDTNYTATAQRVITGTDYYAVRIPFADMTVTPAFQWTNITALSLEMLSEISNSVPSPLYLDHWQLVELTADPYDDQDWWPEGTNDAYWGDDTDAEGGWHTWELVDEPLAGYPVKALKLSGYDANSNYYIGGNGFSLLPIDRDWSDFTCLSLLARRGDTTNAEPLLSISLRDSSGIRTAQVSVVVVPTNYLPVRVPFDDMTVSDGFSWSNVASVVFEFLSGEPASRPSDLYLKMFEVGTASNRFEQDWWMAGEGYQPWGDAAWTQTADAASGTYALQISGVITNDTQWYIGGNGCSMAVPQQDWSDSGAIILYGKQGAVSNRVQPKFKLTLDNDYAETNGNEAVIETKVANTSYYEMVIAFDDFTADAGFAWTNVKMVKIEYFTGEGGKQPNDLYLDHLRRAAVTLTNGMDNTLWKGDWCDQLYALEDFADADPADPDSAPDYADISRVFRNIHMINWFHVNKFEDGFTKDLRIAEDGIGGVPYGSYYERIQDDYFLTNVLHDSDYDGLPDDWELDYFGDPTNAVPSEDDDDDRQNNWQEYLAGTVPTNRDDFFCMDAVAQSSVSNGFIIEWASTAGRRYAIDCTHDLRNGFEPAVSNIAAYPPVNVYTASVHAATSCMYRVRVVP